jgi:hypothetical protein
VLAKERVEEAVGPEGQKEQIIGKDQDEKDGIKGLLLLDFFLKKEKTTEKGENLKGY